jgi:SAM-dependent methyltransferase
MKNKLKSQNIDYQRLKQYQQVWQKKKILKKVYYQWYQKIKKDLIKGKTLELGSGIGSFKQFYPAIISSDIVICEWLDECIDAQKIPFKANLFSNIVMIDVLHHLQKPMDFFKEANRVLEPGGKLILIEPFPSPFSLIAYKLFHPEPFIFSQNIFSTKLSKKTKQPWDSNQAIAYLFFYKHLKEFNQIWGKKLKIVKKQKFSFLLYPLSGGFENKQLVSDWLFPLVKLFELLLTPFKDLIAFRCYLVLQKN